MESTKLRVSVIIPAYKVSKHIVQVVQTIPEFVAEIIVVDDNCPENSGMLTRQEIVDPRVKVVIHEQNQGVGGAMASGYLEALKGQCDVFVKIDGDGQMNPIEIRNLIQPIIQGNADYVKGNRLSSITSIRQMPLIRIFGNILLSFMARFSTGYWNIFDFNNGFTAITRQALERVEISELHKRYFFESDMLHELYLSQMVVVDVPMQSRYGVEKSNLSIIRTVLTFPLLHLRNTIRRIVSTYILRDFSVVSMELIAGVTLFVFGFIYGLVNYLHSSELKQSTPTGTLILVAISILGGLQLLISFLTYDTQNVPKK